MSNSNIEEFIKNIPKAELHIHIEGSFEPELMFEIAKRNNIKIKYQSPEELKKAYSFNNLQEFLDIYYQGASVLITEDDFYDLTWAYLKKANSQNVIHAEIFFDPQTHTSRGVSFNTVVDGINRALQDGKTKLGISSKLIMCFLRDLDENYALQTLDEAVKYKNIITAVGLDSAEIGNPPSKFEKVFKKAINNGFLTVAHAGEEGPSEYIWESIKLLKVSRIDHGNHCLDDNKLVDELVRIKMPLTVCPLSNYKLKVDPILTKHPLKIMMDKGLLVSVNSDDPAYFGGYINENFIAIAKALNLSKDDIYQLVINSFESSFVRNQDKQKMIEKAKIYYNKSI